MNGQLSTLPAAAAPSKTPFLNRHQVRRFLLERATETRAHKYTQVSEETLLTANEVVRTFLSQHVRTLPSKGRRV